jgi:hypothetical protein
MRLIVFLFAVPLLAGAALAGYPGPYGAVNPGPKQQHGPRYNAGHDHGDYERPIRVILSEAYFNPIDLTVRDMFYFVGAPMQIPPGLTLGVNRSGREIRVPLAINGGAGGGAYGVGAGYGPALSAPSVAPASGLAPRSDRSPYLLHAILAEDAANDDGLSLLGYEEGAVILPREEMAPSVSPRAGSGDLLSRATASLQAGRCAECHTVGQKPKGGVALFLPEGGLASGIDWRAVLAYTTAPDSRRCPPAPRGRLTEEQLGAIRELAR